MFDMREVLEYLETMVAHDLADELEHSIYTNLRWDGSCSKKELDYVTDKMSKWLD